MKLQDFSVTAKCLATLVLMAAVAIGSNLSALQSMSRIDRDYTELLEQEAKSTLAMARANRVLTDIERLTFFLIAEPDDAGMRRIVAQTDQEIENFYKQIDEARRLPETRDRIDAIAASFRSTVALLPDAQKATLNKDDALSLKLVKEGFAPAAAKLRNDILAFNQDLAGRLDQATADASAFVARVYNMTLILAGGGILLCFALAVWVARSGIAQPINRIVVALERLAGGDVAVEVVGADRKDEVGAIARTLAIFKDNLIRSRAMEQEAKEAEARAQAERRRSTLELAARFEQRVGGVVDAVGSAATELQATASQLAAAVEEVSTQCVAVSAASEQASANVQTVASASEEMSASIHELSQRVGRAADRSKAAAEGTGQAQRELDALSGAIEQVGQIVASINAVASQTNLLALNATIEAARAGEAGKGFAVVASEVKNLANQTHAMTGQIGDQISAVKGASERTVAAMRAIIGQVGEIDHSTNEMAASVEQQSAATSEISRNAQQAAVGTAEVSRNVNGIQQAENETSAATHNVKHAADSLAGQAAMLKQEMDSFLSEIRAA